MNEGHSAFATLALLEEQSRSSPAREFSEVEIETVRHQCAFTTHTPVPAGHDRFNRSSSTDPRQRPGEALTKCSSWKGPQYDGSRAAAVRLRQRRVHEPSRNSRAMFPNPLFKRSQTVCMRHLDSPPFASLYGRFPGWRTDNRYLRYAVGVPLNEIRHARGSQEGIIPASSMPRRDAARPRSSLSVLRDAPRDISAATDFTDRSASSRSPDKSDRYKLSSPAKRIHGMKAARRSFATSSKQRRPWLRTFR